MKALGSKYSAKDIKFLIKCADKDENEKMDMDEFCMTATIMVILFEILRLKYRHLFLKHDNVRAKSHENLKILLVKHKKSSSQSKICSLKLKSET